MKTGVSLIFQLLEGSNPIPQTEGRISRQNTVVNFPFNPRNHFDSKVGQLSKSDQIPVSVNYFNL